MNKKIKSKNQLKELHSKEYVDMYEKKPISRISRLLKYINFNSTHKVVDCACGNGMLMNLVCPLVEEYHGVDFSKDFIESAERRKETKNIDNAKFYCEDINIFFQTRHNQYDSAFALDFSEHVYDDEWLKILKSIHYSLKKGGSLYIHTPNANFFIEILKAKEILLKQFPEHIAVRTMSANKNLLALVGFTQITCKFLPHYNILKYIHWLSFIPIIGTWLYTNLLFHAKETLVWLAQSDKSRSGI